MGFESIRDHRPVSSEPGVISHESASSTRFAFWPARSETTFSRSGFVIRSHTLSVEDTIRFQSTRSATLPPPPPACDRKEARGTPSSRRAEDGSVSGWVACLPARGAQKNFTEISAASGDRFEKRPMISQAGPSSAGLRAYSRTSGFDIRTIE